MRVFAFLVLAALAVLGASEAFAGGGPETTLVVVNDDSPLSKQIANAYVQMRGIHPTHVCRLTGIPNLTVIPIDTFRERILDPVRAYIAEHGLDEEIDIVAYSADFPFGINYDSDFKGETLPQGVHKFRVASLTGLTYLHLLVDKKDQGYLDLQGGANRYCRLVVAASKVHHAHGYRRAYRWSDDPEPEIGDGAKGEGGYFLSTMLAATGVQGNTTDEVLAYLGGAVKADGTRPDGTVYLMDHKDVRSTTRSQFFGATMKLLEAMDRPGEILVQGEGDQDGKVPICKDDVIGLVAGIAGFDWAACKSRLLPGSIAEHLTSFGAKLDGSGQTKCTEFLRAGAAGTSGAVAEPYALWMKFPLPFLHAHYAQGACLVEAFYQNVLAPYQLLVLGDPLARPFADLQAVTMSGTNPTSTWSGTVSIGATVKADSSVPAGALELWIDGRLVSKGPPENPFEIDTTTLEDGGHTLRLVAVEGSDLETRSSTVYEIRVKNGENRVTLTTPKKPVRLDDGVVLTGKAKGAQEVEVFLGTLSLGTAKVKRSSWRLEVPASVFGIGVSPIFARATYREGPCVRSRIRDVGVEAPEPLAPDKKRRPKRKKKKDDDDAKGPKDGLAATVVDNKGKTHELVATFIGRQGKEHFAKQIGAEAPGTPKSITLLGELEVTTAGFYRLAINASGKLTIKIHGRTVFEGEDLVSDRQAYAAFTLEAGWHPITVEYEPASGSDLGLMLGGAKVSAFLSGKAIRH